MPPGARATPPVVELPKVKVCNAVLPKVGVPYRVRAPETGGGISNGGGAGGGANVKGL